MTDYVDSTTNERTVKTAEAQRTIKVPQPGAFGMVPYALAVNPRLGAVAVRLYAILAAYANKAGECWPKQEDLATSLGLSRRAVAHPLEELKVAGYVELVGHVGHTPKLHLPAHPANGHLKLARGVPSEAAAEPGNGTWRAIKMADGEPEMAHGVTGNGTPRTNPIPLTDQEQNREQTSEQTRAPARGRPPLPPPDPLRILWADALAELQLQTSPAHFRDWYQDARLLSFEDGHATIEASEFVAPLLTEGCLALLARALSFVSHQDVTVTIAVAP